MSLSDNIWNSLTGHNVHTMKVSAEQLAAIINDAFIKNATSIEELNRIEYTVNGGMTFRRMDSEDGRFHLYVSYFERGLTQHRYVFVKNYETEEVFEWKGFNLSPLKKAVAPYLLYARMNPSDETPPVTVLPDTTPPVASIMSSDIAEDDKPMNAQMDIGSSPYQQPRHNNFGNFVIIALIVAFLCWACYTAFFSDRVVGTWKNVWLENKYGTVSLQTIAEWNNKDIKEYQGTLVFRRDGTVTWTDFQNSNTYYWKKNENEYQLYISEDEEEPYVVYTMEDREGKKMLVFTLDTGSKMVFSDDENIEVVDDINYTDLMMQSIQGSSGSSNDTGSSDGSAYAGTPSSGQSSSYGSSSSPSGSQNSILNDDDVDYEDDDYEADTDDDDEEEYGGEYIFPNSDTSYLSKSDLKGMTKSQINLAKNELYARHGRMFRREDLQEYFDECSWYTPEYTPEEWDEYGDSYFFNEYEIANRNLLNKQEKKK